MLRSEGRLQGTRRHSSGWYICQSPGGYLDGKWHHVVATSTSGGSSTIWVDGTRTTCAGDGLVQIFDVGNDLFIGRHGNSGVDYDFDGTMDDVRIYNRVLDNSEIAALYAGQ